MSYYNELRIIFLNKIVFISAISIFIFLGCSKNIEIYEDGNLVDTLSWDKTYVISLEVPRNSVCWIETDTENIDYFSGAILSDNDVTHISKGEFISKLDFLNFEILLKKDFSLNIPKNSKINIDINCNNNELKFKKTYDIN